MRSHCCVFCCFAISIFFVSRNPFDFFDRRWASVGGKWPGPAGGGRSVSVAAGGQAAAGRWAAAVGGQRRAAGNARRPGSCAGEGPVVGRRAFINRSPWFVNVSMHLSAWN